MLIALRAEHARWLFSSAELVCICNGSLTPKLGHWHSLHFFFFFLPHSDTLATELPVGVTGSKRKDVDLGRPLISWDWGCSQEKMRPWAELRKALAKLELWANELIFALQLFPKQFPIRHLIQKTYLWNKWWGNWGSQREMTCSDHLFELYFPIFTTISLVISYMPHTIQGTG